MKTGKILEQLNYDPEYPNADDHLSGGLIRAIDAKLRAAEKFIAHSIEHSEYMSLDRLAEVSKLLLSTTRTRV